MLQDLRYAVRSLVKRPGFTAIAVLTLALGIGATSAIFSVVDAALLRPLPYEDSHELVLLWQTDRHNDERRAPASIPDFEDWRQQGTSFEGIAGWTTGSANLVDRGAEPRPERLSVGAVSTSMFSLLGVQPALGRTFTTEEDEPGSQPVALLSHGLWQRRFGEDPGVLGRDLDLDGQLFQIIGVMPSKPLVPEADLWTPLWTRTEATRNIRGVHNLLVLGRLRAGVDLDSAQQEMSTIMVRLEDAYPEDNANRGAFVEPLYEGVVRTSRPALLLLSGAVALVLLLACANVANLSLLRASSRRAELALRSTLGASRGQLLRQLLTESLLLGIMGGVSGLLLAAWLLDGFLALLPPSLGGLDAVGLDLRVVGFAAAASVLAGLLVGLLPAWQASRRDLRSVMQAGGRGGQGRDGSRLRSSLAALQLAVALVLSIAAGLLLQSFSRLLDVQPGFQPQKLVSMNLQLPETRYPFPEQYPNWTSATQFFDQVLTETRQVPGAVSVALAHQGPTNAGWTTRVTIDGRPQVEADRFTEEVLRPVTPEYFRTAGIPLLQGRDLEASDRQDSPKVVVVNRAFADQYFEEGETAVGAALTFWGQSRRIVGVVDNVRFRGVGEKVVPAMYPPLTQAPMGNFQLLVRTAGEPTALAPELRAAIWSIDPELAVFGVTSLEDALTGGLAQPRFQALLVGLFGLVALGLAALGVYGVVAFGVSQRFREFGIRLALGARPGRVQRQVIVDGLRLGGLAIGLGVVAALALNRWLAGLLYGVAGSDPLTLTAAAGLLLLVTLVACYLPARRAASIDPVQTLRYE